MAAHLQDDGCRRGDDLQHGQHAQAAGKRELQLLRGVAYWPLMGGSCYHAGSIPASML
jgi:hypothetical protein